MADKKISALTSATTPLAGTEVLPIVQSNTTVKVSAANITAGRAVSTLSVNSTGPNGIPITLQEITALPSSALAAYVGVTTSAFPGGANGDVVIIPRTSGANDVRVYVGSGTPTEAVVVQGSTKDLRMGSGNLVPAAAAKGVNFTANTPAAGMTSQLLNWYEEGTFTPTIAGTTSAGTGTYSAQTGRYTRTGNRVYINLYLSWSAHTGTGNMRIDGLPFTSANVAGTYSALSPYISGLTLTAGYWLQPYIGVNRTYISLEQVQAGALSIAVPIDTSAEIIISGFYEV